MSASSGLDERVAWATRRLAQLTARQLLRERRVELRQKLLQRREEARRRFAFGDVVLNAGMGDWEPAEVLGVLLEGKARFGSSPTQRLALRQQAEAHSDSPSVH